MKRERMQQVLTDLQNLGTLTLEDAARRYQCSEATLRRDFIALTKSGMAKRIRGGIETFKSTENNPLPLELRNEWNSAEKKALAQALIKYLDAQPSLIVHGGSTTAYLGLYLNSGIVITDFPALSNVFRERFPDGGGPELFLTGGKFDSRTGNLCGAALRHSLQEYQAEIAVTSFFSLDGNGLYEIDSEYAEQISLLCERAQKRIVIMDHDKFSRKVYFRSLSWNKVNTLIIADFVQDHATVKAARDCGVEIIAVPVPLDATPAPQ